MKPGDDFMDKWIKVPSEHTRTYHYIGGSITVNGVEAFFAKNSFSGNGVCHRLKCRDGSSYYIEPGWMAIQFNDPNVFNEEYCNEDSTN